MGKHKDAVTKGNTMYTTVVADYFTELMVQAAQKAVPDGLTEEQIAALTEEQKHIRRTKLTAQQQQYYIDHAQELVDEFSADIFEYTYKYPTEQINALALKLEPDYRRLQVKEQIEREVLGEKLRKAFSGYSAQRQFMQAVCDNGAIPLKRPEQVMIEVSYSEANLQKGMATAAALTGNDVKAKRAVYQDFFRKVSAIDLTGLDVMDDNNLADNFDRYKTLLSVGPELKNLLIEAAGLGLDYTGEEYKPLIAKMGLISEIAYMARVRIDMITHPVYSQIDFSQLKDHFSLNNITDAEGEDVDLEEFFLQWDTPENRAAESAIEQFGRLRTMQQSNPLFNTDDPQKTADQRMAEYLAAFGSQKQEMEPVKPEVVLDGDELIPAEYTDFATEEELQGLEPEDTDGIVEEVLAELKDGKEPYRRAMERNIELLQEIIPGFTVSPEDREKYYSDKRIAVHEAFADYDARHRQTMEEYKGRGIHHAYRRIGFTFFDLSGTPEAAEKNQKIFEGLSRPDQAGEAFRKEKFIESLNALQGLDASKFLPGTDLNETFDYILQNISLLERGVEWQNVNRYKAEDLCIEFSEEDEKNLTNIENKGVVVGGKGANYARVGKSPVFLEFPFEDIPDDQLQTVLEKLPAVMTRHGYTPAQISNHVEMVQAIFFSRMNKDYTEPEPKHYTLADVKDRKPTFAQAKEQMFRLYADMLEATTLQELGEDSPYSKMVESLNRAMNEMASADGPIEASKAASIRIAGLELAEAVRQYQIEMPDPNSPGKIKAYEDKHPGVRFTEEDLVRMDLAKKLSSFVHMNLVDEMKYQTLICTHNEPQGIAYDPEMFEEASKIRAYMEEMQLDYETIRESAQNNHVTPEEYIKNAYEQSFYEKFPVLEAKEQAAADKQKAALRADEMTEFNTLGDVHHFLDAEGEKSMENLVKAFRACNRISAENVRNQTQCLAAGELLNSVGEKISELIASQLRDKPVLSREDIRLAKDTMRRHYAAAEALKADPQVSKEASQKVLGAVEKGGRVLQ